MYASNTRVPVDRSKAEIEHILTRYGADSFAYYAKGPQAMVAFTYKGRMIRMTVPLPSVAEASLTPTGRKRRETAATIECAQETARRWRALLLVIKAKLEAVESNICLFEDEFLPYTVLPGGETFAEWARPQVDKMIATGQAPRLLLGKGDRGE